MGSVAPPPPRSGELDRLVELTNIGAGHAAGALASMLGGTCWMTVPVVAPLGELPEESLFGPGDDGETALQDPGSGIFFEIGGGLPRSVAVLLPADSCREILDRLLGANAAVADAVERSSALQELGNILVSHVVSAIAETVGQTILPSAPHLALQRAVAVLDELVERRLEDGPGLRVETCIVDGCGRPLAVLVFLPGA